MDVEDLGRPRPPIQFGKWSRMPDCLMPLAQKNAELTRSPKEIPMKELEQVFEVYGSDPGMSLEIAAQALGITKGQLRNLINRNEKIRALYESASDNWGDTHLVTAQDFAEKPVKAIEQGQDITNTYVKACELAMKYHMLIGMKRDRRIGGGVSAQDGNVQLQVNTVVNIRDLSDMDNATRPGQVIEGHATEDEKPSELKLPL